MGISDINAQRKNSNTHTHMVYGSIYIKGTKLTNKYSDKI